MCLLFKHIIVSLILSSFLMLAFFSFVPAMHGMDGGAKENCPFSAMGTPLCSGDMFAATLHHISLYHSFFNVLVGWSITMSIFLLLAALCTAVVFSTSPPPPALQVFRGRVHDVPLLVSAKRNMTHWLSLFEQSPSR